VRRRRAMHKKENKRSGAKEKKKIRGRVIVSTLRKKVLQSRLTIEEGRIFTRPGRGGPIPQEDKDHRKSTSLPSFKKLR